MGAVYIPPENSKYSSRDSSSMVELEMLELDADNLNMSYLQVISMQELELT